MLGRARSSALLVLALHGEAENLLEPLGRSLHPLRALCSGGVAVAREVRGRPAVEAAAVFVADGDQFLLLRRRASRVRACLPWSAACRVCVSFNLGGRRRRGLGCFGFRAARGASAPWLAALLRCGLLGLLQGFRRRGRPPELGEFCFELGVLGGASALEVAAPGVEAVGLVVRAQGVWPHAVVLEAVRVQSEVDERWVEPLSALLTLLGVHVLCLRASTLAAACVGRRCALAWCFARGVKVGVVVEVVRVASPLGLRDGFVHAGVHGAGVAVCPGDHVGGGGLPAFVLLGSAEPVVIVRIVSPQAHLCVLEVYDELEGFLVWHLVTGPRCERGKVPFLAAGAAARLGAAALQFDPLDVQLNRLVSGRQAVAPESIPEGAVDRDDVLLAVHNRRSLAVALDEAAQPLPSLCQDLPALGSPLVEVKVDDALAEAF